MLLSILQDGPHQRISQPVLHHYLGHSQNVLKTDSEFWATWVEHQTAQKAWHQLAKPYFFQTPP